MRIFNPLVSLLIFLPIAVQAQSPLQIDWGSSTIVDTITDSTGAPISSSTYAIELGGFSSGFVPTQANVDDWLANWQVFDAVTDPDSDSGDFFIAGSGTDARFAGTDFLDIDQTSLSEDGNGTDIFAVGSQAYVFIRNSDVTNPNSEWLLYTSQSGEDWEFPAVQGGQTQVPLTWFAGEADEVVFGGIHDAAGPGEFTSTGTDFLLRTHTFVPEPSTALLVLAASCALGCRRRRSAQ